MQLFEQAEDALPILGSEAYAVVAHHQNQALAFQAGTQDHLRLRLARAELESIVQQGIQQVPKRKAGQR